jgi:hypothetical protein
MFFWTSFENISNWASSSGRDRKDLRDCPKPRIHPAPSGKKDFSRKEMMAKSKDSLSRRRRVLNISGHREEGEERE